MWFSSLHSLHTNFLCCTFLCTEHAALLGHVHRWCPTSPHPQHFPCCYTSLFLNHLPLYSFSASISSLLQWWAICPNHPHFLYLVSSLYLLNFSTYSQLSFSPQLCIVLTSFSLSLFCLSFSSSTSFSFSQYLSSLCSSSSISFCLTTTISCNCWIIKLFCMTMAIRTFISSSVDSGRLVVVNRNDIVCCHSQTKMRMWMCSNFYSYWGAQS